jgi:hypothetical protein
MNMLIKQSKGVCLTLRQRRQLQQRFLDRQKRQGRRPQPEQEIFLRVSNQVPSYQDGKILIFPSKDVISKDAVPDMSSAGPRNDVHAVCKVDVSGMSCFTKLG